MRQSQAGTCNHLQLINQKVSIVFCRFVGKCDPLPKGYWVGVEFDEPVGRNDGSVKGHKFFHCSEGYGSFQRPENVTVGDFPPVDEFAFSDGDEIQCKAYPILVSV